MNRPSHFRRLAVLVLAIAIVAVPRAGLADVTMPKIFGDHMVLQRDGKVAVWGWADPGETVTV